MDKQTIENIMNIVSPELMYILFQFFGVTLIFLSLKGLVTSISNYFKMRFSLWGLNTKLLINGKVGYVQNITFKDVVLYISDKETMYIPIEKFLKMDKTVFHNGYLGDEK